MKQDLLTAGEFAKLACTTKRTVQYYDKLGILKPLKVDSNGYRYYKQEQIIDFQIILLLRTLKIPLREIKKYLTENRTLKDLFDANKRLVREEVRYLEYTLKGLEKFFRSLEKNGTLVKPKIKQVKPFRIYYINKVGSYSKIAGYCQELVDMFRKIPGEPVTLTVFQTKGYEPQASKMKISIIQKKGMTLKKEYKNIVKQGKVNRFKALTYMHNGSGSTLSLFWKETEKYMRIKRIKRDWTFPSLEIYWKVSDKPYEQFFEIFVPVK